MTCNYSSFVLLATAPRAVPNHTVPDRFGGWSLINNPIFTLLWLPSPEGTLSPPCPVPAEGLPRGEQDQRSVQSPQGAEGALGVAHGQQAPHSDATEVLGCPGRLQATGRRGPGVPCTLQGTCRATSQSGSYRLPCGSTKGALSGKKNSHTKSRPYLTGCTLQLLSPGRAWAPAQLLPISGFSPNICISPKYFLDIHSREQGDAHEMPGKLPVLSLCLSSLRECAAAIGHHSPL